MKEEPMEELSLAARLMNRMKIGLANQTFVVDPVPAPVPASVKATGGGVKRAPKAKMSAAVASPEKSEDAYSASDFAASYSPGTPADKPAKKIKAVAKKPAAVATKKLAPPAAKKTTTKKKAAYDSDEDDEMFDDNDSDDDSVSGDTPVAPRAMPSRARKPIVYDAGGETEDDIIDEESDNYEDEGDDDPTWYA